MNNVFDVATRQHLGSKGKDKSETQAKRAQGHEVGCRHERTEGTPAASMRGCEVPSDSTCRCFASRLAGERSALCSLSKLGEEGYRKVALETCGNT